MLRAVIASIAMASAADALHFAFPRSLVANATGGKVAKLGGIDTNCWKGPFPASQSSSFEVSTNITSPGIGDWLGLSFKFDLAADVTSGSVVYNTVVNGFIPYDVTDDLCTDAANAGNPCPLNSGSTYTMTGGVLIPSVTAFKLTEEWLDQDGNQICCATVSYSF